MCPASWSAPSEAICDSSRARPDPDSSSNSTRRFRRLAMYKPSKPINLLILDDHDMFREGLVRTLEREPDMQVVAQCGTSREALALLNRAITMVLLDVDLGNERALGFVEQARSTGYEGPILVVT